MTKKLIAIAAEDDKGLAGEVSHHFGRCPYYVLAEIDGDKCIKDKVVQNPFYGNHMPGQMPKFIHDLGANVILAGGISPQNVMGGIRNIRPAGVDSCTRTNALDENGRPIRFKKDLAKVRMLVEQVRAAEKSLAMVSKPHLGRGP